MGTPELQDSTTPALTMTLKNIFWHTIPPTRFGVFSGRIHCPCEVQFWDIMEQFFSNLSGKTLVDLGSGPGVKALTFAAAGAKVIGFEARESAILHARQNLRQTQAQHPEIPIVAEFHQRDIERGLTEIDDASVDIVLFVEVIEHLEGYVTVLEEIQRILRPGGKVVITTPNKNFHQNQKEDDEHVYGEKAYGHVRDFDLDGLVKEIEQAGLKIEAQGFINPPKSTLFCKWIHPWMIRDHGFLQQKEQNEDVIGIRSLGFLQPVYNAFFPIITLLIQGYNALIFPILYRITKPSLTFKNGKTLLAIGVKS